MRSLVAALDKQVATHSVIALARSFLAKKIISVLGERRFSMTRSFTFGKILDGSVDALEKSYEQFSALPVDQKENGEPAYPSHSVCKTIARKVSVSAPGTYQKNEIRDLQIEPCDKPGWWFDRTDLPDSLPIKVSARNVWTTGDVVSNIVLRSGSKSNYVRMVEHIIALKAGMDVDSLLIRFKSGDPPLFDFGSQELVEAIERGGREELDTPVRYFTVRETISMATPYGGFVRIEPCEAGSKELYIDCARNFSDAIGRQRIQFSLSDMAFKYGATARTNTTAKQKLFVTTIGKLFANMRNLGYNKRNVLIAGKRKYVNEPRLLRNGKSLEAVWHRAILDLLAALALIEEGRFVGKITDYKGSHYADVELVKLLYAQDLLVEV